MHAGGTDVPWEDKRCNPFMALYQTILRVMFNAPRFFAALPASNGKLTAYMMMHELDFVVTSDEVLEYYKDTFPMEDLEALLPADLREALADQLFFNTDADGKTTAIALDMTRSRFVAGTGADADPNVQHTYYFFVPAGAPHPEQIVQFLRYSFGL